jgi:hypothetical protein
MGEYCIAAAESSPGFVKKNCDPRLEVQGSGPCLSPNASRKFANDVTACGFAVENPIRRPENRPAGGWSVISTGPHCAMGPHRYVTPCGFRRLRDVFPSGARTACS